MNDVPNNITFIFLKLTDLSWLQEACKLSMKLWDYQPIDAIQLHNDVRDAKNKTMQALKYKPFVLNETIS